MERNLKMVVAYDGTDFHGWQRQPGLRTVQGELEAAAQRVLRHPLAIRGSGRTDSGVHARGQVANVHTHCSIPRDNLRHAIGGRLPEDISLLEVSDVHPDFDAISSAVCKCYRYRIHNHSRRSVDRLSQRYTYHCWHELDAERMQRAAFHFIGTMDFTAMAGAGCERETMVRTVLRCDVHRHFDEIRVDVIGKGFLYHQVRNMAGTLIEIGRGHWPIDKLPEILESEDRSNAGPTAPAQGLSLQWVQYPAPLLQRPAVTSPN
jgi:tRNA pseudouridine38-40 synthase